MSMPWNPAAPPPPGEANWGVQPGQDTHTAWWSRWQQRNYPGGTAQMVFLPGTTGQRPEDAAWWGDVNQSYRWYEPDVKEFYEENPAQAYQGFLDWGFGDRERPLAQYARGYYARAYADALAGQEGANGLAAGQVTPPSGGSHWVDYLSPNLVYQIRQSFQMQSASNRGVVNQWMPAGRMTG